LLKIKEVSFTRNMKTNRFHQNSQTAFTLIELLAVLAMVALLSCLLLPALAKARQSPQAIQCLNNHRQLMMAALVYAEDSSGIWFPNQPAGQAGERDWVTDNEDFNPGNPNNYNISLLLNPATDFFAKYVKSPRIFHCPGDQSRVPQGPRIRSISASQAVGTQWLGTCGHKPGDPVTGQWLTGLNSDCDNTWRRYGKASDMVAPSPASLWVFADEHCNSINDAGFAVEVANTGFGARWIDIPANYHNGAAGFSFADGHVELHKWLGSVASWPVNWTGPAVTPFPVVANSTDVQDIQWIQQRTSARN
jgi:prepilin-type N-terminal cleavage/methylation domain-containing protein/prepilin-type processing-associated H-X9-DG protein